MPLPSERATEVVKERGKTYGHPRPIFEATAALWSAYIGYPVLPDQVPYMMMLHKLAREINNPLEDNRTDMAGYVNTAEMMHLPQEGQP